MREHLTGGIVTAVYRDASVAAITESEWLARTQSTEMLGLLRDRASEKDLLRFAVACCRRIWLHLHDERSRRAVEMVASETSMDSSRRKSDSPPRCGPLWHSLMRSPGLTTGPTAISITRLIPPPSACTRTGCRFARSLTNRSSPGLSIAPCSWPSRCAYAAAIQRALPIRPIAQMHAQLAVETEAEYAEQCHLLRGIFAYPFAS